MRPSAAVLLRRVAPLVVTAVVLSGCATLVRSSVAGDGTQASGPSLDPALSDGGRILAFTSSAPDLVADDGNGVADVFVRDHQTGTTERVSVADDEGEGDGASGSPSVSDDGRLVAFTSESVDLVAGEDDPLADVFVRDRPAGTTRRITPTAPRPTRSIGPELSGNGRHIVYVQESEVYPGVTVQSVITTDLETGSSTTIAASEIRPPIEPARFSSLAISDDGGFVVYGSSARHSLGITFSGLTLWARATGQRTSIASATSPGTVGEARISGDGGAVAFSSTNDVVVEEDDCPEDQMGGELSPACDADVFAYDRVAGGYEAISASAGSGPLVGEHRRPSIDDRGRLVLFASDDGSSTRLRVRDRRTALTETVSPAGDITGGTLTGDGQLVALVSSEALVGDDTNGVLDVHVRRALLPVAQAVAPATIARGTGGLEVLVRGRGFRSGTTLFAEGGGVRLSNVRLVDPSTLRATVDVDPDAATGSRTLGVVTAARFPRTGVGSATTPCPGCLQVT